MSGSELSIQPDLPLVNTSARKCFRRCPRQWVWSYVDGLQVRGDQADALWLGTGVHLALAEWYQPGYKRGQHPARTFEKWADGEVRYVRSYLGENFEDAVWEDAVELGTAMLENYIDEYGKDPDWYIIAIEQQFKVKLTYQGDDIAWFFGTFDGVLRLRSDRRVYLIEHKTAGQISLPYLVLDDQAGGYWAVATRVLRARGVLRSDEYIAGIIYNFLRKAKPDDRPQDESGQYLNKDGSVSRRQPPPYFTREIVERSPAELRSTLLRLKDEVYLMNLVRNGELPIIKNTTRECTFCEFFHMCQLHERGGEAWRTLAAEYNRRDPYENYTKSAAE